MISPRHFLVRWRHPCTVVWAAESQATCNGRMHWLCPSVHAMHALQGSLWIEKNPWCRTLSQFWKLPLVSPICVDYFSINTLTRKVTRNALFRALFMVLFRCPMDEIKAEILLGGAICQNFRSIRVSWLYCNICIMHGHFGISDI